MPDAPAPRRVSPLATWMTTIALASLLPACHPEETQEPPPDFVDGTLVQLNDNGAWCWYQDERAIVDPATHTLVVGSVAAAPGPGGVERSGDIDLVTYDLATGAVQKTTIDHIGIDDHDAPALLIRPDGRYLAMYSNHRTDPLSRYRVSTHPHDATEWDAKHHFNWNSIHSDFYATYSNIFYLAAEDRVYDFVRADGRSPNVLVSDDQGTSWTYGGKLSRGMDVGYVNGYFKYASDGVSRIDFVGTEHHPRDYDTSIYHGYIEGGKVYMTDGTPLDDELFDEDAREPADFTPVFRAGTVFDGVAMTHAWPSDFEMDEHGNLTLVFTARAGDDPENSNFSDHRFFYARLVGSSWHVVQLAKAGAPLFAREQDYTGLAAIDPGNHHVVYVSTPYDPRTGKKTKKHEIYKGLTNDEGEHWMWVPITQRSTVDNLRPIMPHWDAQHRALLWLRGTMTSSQIYDLAVVGIIDPLWP